MYLLPQRGICTSLRRLFVFGSRVYVLCLPAGPAAQFSMRAHIFVCGDWRERTSRRACESLSLSRSPRRRGLRLCRPRTSRIANTHSHVFRSRRVCKSGGADLRVFSLRARVGSGVPRCAPCAVCAERSGAFLQAASGSQRSAPRLRRGVCVAAKPGAHLAAKPP